MKYHVHFEVKQNVWVGVDAETEKEATEKGRVIVESVLKNAQQGENFKVYLFETEFVGSRQPAAETTQFVATKD